MADWRDVPEERGGEAGDTETIRRQDITRVATHVELTQLAEQAWQRTQTERQALIERALHESLGVDGRRALFPDARVVEFGRRLWLARRIAGMSQRRLAQLTGVSQSTISRLERGVAPSVGIDRLVALESALGRALPLGVCPHEHNCPWQPPPREPTREARLESFVARLMAPDVDSPRPTVDIDW